MTFNNSKIVSDKIMTGNDGNLKFEAKGNTSDAHVGLSSLTKGVTNPTTDSDDLGYGGSGRSPSYGLSNPGGASGDGPTPGYDGSGLGQDTLNGAQNNQSERGLAF